MTNPPVPFEPCHLCAKMINEGDLYYCCSSQIETLEGIAYSVREAEGLLMTCMPCWNLHQPHEHIESEQRKHLSQALGKPIHKLYIYGEYNHYQCCLCHQEIVDGHPLYVISHGLETVTEHSVSVSEAWFGTICCIPCSAQHNLLANLKQTITQYRLPESTK